MKTNILFKILLIIGVSYGVFYLTHKKAQKENAAHILKVGTNAEYPPFAFVEGNTIVGFDIDIIKEVAKRLGKEIDIQDLPFTTLIPYLTVGKIQVIAAGMTPTKERAKQVIFTKPYLDGDPLIVISPAKNPPITSIKDLSGKEVVVNQGFTADSYMSALSRPIVTKLPAIHDAFMALNSGRADAFVSAKSVVQPFFKQHGIDKYNIYEIPNTADTYALAISKKYPKLAQEIQNILDEMEEDGTIDHLKHVWNL